MADAIENIDQLLTKASSEQLYKALINQLNKDFSLSNSTIQFSETLTPNLLIEGLNTIIAKLIHDDFDTFVNLLYRIDVPERQIRKISNTDFDHYVAEVSFLLLKREWQKVWLRNTL